MRFGCNVALDSADARKTTPVQSVCIVLNDELYVWMNNSVKCLCLNDSACYARIVRDRQAYFTEFSPLLRKPITYLYCQRLWLMGDASKPFLANSWIVTWAWALVLLCTVLDPPSIYLCRLHDEDSFCRSRYTRNLYIQVPSVCCNCLPTASKIAVLPDPGRPVISRPGTYVEVW